MQQAEFARLLDLCTEKSIAYAKTMVLNKLPDHIIYRVRPNQSCDTNLSPDEVVYPEDSLESLDEFIEMDRVGCLRFLYRDGRIPVWIDVSVVAANEQSTYVDYRCCGRFTNNDNLLYYGDQGPFSIKSPILPPEFSLEETEQPAKFWLR